MLGVANQPGFENLGGRKTHVSSNLTPTAVIMHTERVRHLLNGRQLPSFEETVDILREVADIIDDRTGMVSQGLWPKWFRERGYWTVLNRDFVDSLYSDIARLGTVALPIVEICAGRGRLAYHLRQKGLEVVATDSYSSMHSYRYNEGLVERLDHQEALVKYKPQVVIGSWLPPGPPNGEGDEIANSVLRFPTVDYLFLIGEGIDGNATGGPTLYQELGFALHRLDTTRFALGTTDNLYLNAEGGIEQDRLTGVYLFERENKQKELVPVG